MSLYGNELTEEITPWRLQFRKFVDFDKGDFIGREALLKQKAAGVKQKLVGFVLKERGIPRQGYKILKQGQPIGFVTSGSMSPSTQKAIGLGYVDSEHAKAGNIIEIEIRNQKYLLRLLKAGLSLKRNNQQEVWITMEVRKGLLYSKEHEWVQEVSDSLVRIGITAYAQDQLGDIVYIELPELMPRLPKANPTVVESVKAASDVYSPVTGTIAAVNEN